MSRLIERAIDKLVEEREDYLDFDLTEPEPEGEDIYKARSARRIIGIARSLGISPMDVPNELIITLVREEVENRIERPFSTASLRTISSRILNIEYSDLEDIVQRVAGY